MDLELFLKHNYEVVAATIVSVIGSLKATSYMKKDSLIERLIDFAVGAIVGFLMAFYVSPSIGFIASLIISLISAIGGVLILEALVSSAPVILIDWVKRKLGVK